MKTEGKYLSGVVLYNGIMIHDIALYYVKFHRFVSTSDDKSMRVWEWDIPVDMKYIADPGMHSMPAVTKSPNEKYLACQSLDNKVNKRHHLVPIPIEE